MSTGTTTDDPGSFDLDYVPPSLDSDALAVAVLLYDSSDDENPFTILPNVRVLQIDRHEGPEPSIARFAYVLDDVAAATWGWPDQFEELWPLDAQGDYVVQCDDRLVVAGQNPDGSPLYLFDGFAQIPQVDVTGRSQRVTFAAVGVEARCFDDVLHERIQRDADNPGDTSGDSDATIHYPVRFNPADSSVAGQGGYLANSTATAYYTQLVDSDNNPEGDPYPVFLEPLLRERQAAPNSPVWLAPWTIASACVYLVTIPNPGDDYVTWPSASAITTALQTLVPPPGQPFDPATATAADCDIRDYDASHKGVAEAMVELLGYAGFLMCWQLDSDADGNPETWLKLYRRDAAAAAEPKSVYLAASNAPMDTSTTNLAQFHLSRDTNGLVNAWRCETNQKQVEVSLYLWPLFQPAAGDQTPVSGSTTTGRAAWVKSNWTAETPATQRRKYRWYGGDECGDGHWDTNTQTWSTTALDLSTVFPADAQGHQTYCVRYRPGTDTIVATDSLGRPQRATLEVQFGGAGPWKLVTGGWQLLPDRLGIEVTVEDPENWYAGKAVGDVRGVTWQAAPPSGKSFILRLTTVIEDDRRIKAEAPKRLASPTQFPRERGIDSRDHYQYASIDPSSRNYMQAGGNGTDPVVVRDDTDAATDYAEQMRSAQEMPKLAGSLVIPYITTYYEVGDRIDTIAGRDVDLTCSVGADQGEDPTYPWIVAVSWGFDGRQSTTLQLSDERAKPRNAW